MLYKCGLPTGRGHGGAGQSVPAYLEGEASIDGPTGVPPQGLSLWSVAGGRTAQHHASVDIAGDRWSDVNPVPAFPYVRTGSYVLANVDATYAFSRHLELAIGWKNLFDDHFELAWGFPQPGRTYYLKTRMTF